MIWVAFLIAVFFFVKYLNFGVSGVILATCISLLFLAISMPIQAYKVLKNKKQIKL